MYKLLTFPGEDTDNIFVQAIQPSDGLTKVASAQLHPKIKTFVDALEPNPDKVFILVNALGAGEFYGANVNGDYFEEAQLLGDKKKYADLNSFAHPFGYETFANGGVYRHHKNKDPSKSMGRVAVSAYNPKMHRVELVIEIDRQKASALGHDDLLHTLDEGGHPAVSMGCRVKYDVCSVCGHKSKTRADYCHHAREMMGRILPNGVVVCVYNPRPRFFDISFVIIGADKTSFVMHKLAYAHVPLSVDLAKEAGLKEPNYLDMVKDSTKRKVADLLKDIPAVAEVLKKKKLLREKTLPTLVLDKLAAHPLAEVLTTLSSLGIMLKPEEYQRVVLVKLRRKGLANQLDSTGKVFAPTACVDKSVNFGQPSKVNVKVIRISRPFLENRSVFEPFITKRVLTKESNDSTMADRSFISNDLMDKLSAGYNGYRVTLLEKIASIVTSIATQDIDIQKELGRDFFEDEFVFGSKVKTSMSGAELGLLGFLPLTHLYSAYVKKRRSVGEEVTAADSFVEKHPNFTASMAMGLSRLGIALHRGGYLTKGLNKLIAAVT